MNSPLNDVVYTKIRSQWLYWLGVIAIVSSSLHYFPSKENSVWKIINLTNLTIVTGMLLIIVQSCLQKPKEVKHTACPPVCIWAYLLFHIVSAGYSDTLARPMMYTVKISIILVGGYMLFAYAFNEKTIVAVPWCITIASVICMGIVIYTQFMLGPGSPVSIYKYGTYVSILVSFSATYFMLAKQIKEMGIAIILLIMLSISIQTIGALIAVICGFLVALILTKEGLLRFMLVASVLLVTSLAAHNSFVRKDFCLLEKDHYNIRQRYVEWQAEINIIEHYGITGTGAGSINDYRSAYYDRLPKLNTLQPFDQNGWLAVPAEIGLFGLFCFIWIIWDHGQILLHAHIAGNKKEARMAVALMSALTASAISNIFSSVHYHGVLIAFTLVLSLISRLGLISGVKTK